MGVLSFFPIPNYIKKYKSEILVETGSGTGTGIRIAQQYSEISKIYSCEIDKDQASYLIDHFNYDKRVSIFGLSSEDYLKKILDFKEVADSKSIIFWLDSHFPSADLGKASFDNEKNLKIRLPLETELDAIYNARNPKIYNDIILIDDWRIYEKMDFDGGDLTKIGFSNITCYDNSNFIAKWESSHIINKIKSDTGYLELLPKHD